MAEEAGLDGARPYDLRHAFASLLIHEGRLSVVDIAAQLGHNPTVCLDTYAHVMAEQRGADPISAEQEIWKARRPPVAERPEVLEGQVSHAGFDATGDTELAALPAGTEMSGAQEPVSSKTGRRVARPLRPNRVSIWPLESGGYGIDFTYHGADGYNDAETAEQMLQAAGFATTFRQELDGAWTVRFGPLRTSRCAPYSTATTGDPGPRPHGPPRGAAPRVCRRNVRRHAA